MYVNTMTRVKGISNDIKEEIVSAYQSGEVLKSFINKLESTILQ